MSKRDTNIRILILFVIMFIIFLFSVKISYGLEEDICLGTYYFIIENLNNENTIEYTDLELNEFLNEFGISESNATNYIFNYTDLCFNITNKELPISKSFGGIEDLSIYKESECQIKIEKSLMWGFYKLDTSIPIIDVYIGEEECEEIEFKKNFFEVKYEYPENYIITGIKLWIFLIAIFGLLMVILVRFIKFNNFSNKVLQDYQRGIKNE